MKSNKYDFDYKDIESCLERIGLKNDSVFLSSNIGVLGYPKSKNKNKVLISSKWILAAIKKLLERR